MVEEQNTALWELYKSGIKYQHDMGFDRLFPEFVRFAEGKQWPEETERTKGLPRPVANICDMIVRNKKAGVLNQSIKMIFKPSELPELPGQNGTMDAPVDISIQAAKEYTEFAGVLWNELEQDELNEQAIDDGTQIGSYVFHYFWDKSVSGGKRLRYNGALRGEVIDPINLFVENPSVREIQKQKWVIISQRIAVQDVIAMAKDGKVDRETVDAMDGDHDTQDQGYDAAKNEREGSKMVTLLTRYFRENGEVYWERGTQNSMITRKTRLSPSEVKMTLYPVELGNWKRRKGSAFGIGEIESIMPNQKAINFNMGMMLMSVQQTAWPVQLIKPGALKNQKITNMPGQQVIDYHQDGGDGIKYLNPPQFPGIAITLADKVLELTRTTSGASEVSTGEAFSSNMAAAAVIALQNQAKQPVEIMRKAFERSIKQIGKIWEQFFKCYYRTPRIMTFNDESGEEVSQEFLGSRYADMEFSLTVEVGAGSQYSEALSIIPLDKLYEKQAIDVDTYIKYYPDTAMPYKAQLQRERQQQREEEAAMMQQQMPPGMPVQAMPPVDVAAGNPLEDPAGMMSIGQQLPAIPRPPGVMDQLMGGR